MAAFTLICTTLLLVLALLVLLRAPDLVTWRFTILATEYGNWLSIAALFLLFSNPLNTPANWVLASLNIISCLLFLLPARYAAGLAKPLSQSLNAAFPASSPPADGKPFSWLRLWLPTRPHRIRPQQLPIPTPDGHTLSINFYGALRPGPQPCVILLHGGGWSSGDEHQLPDLPCHLARAGYAVAAMRYRLTPHSCWPAQKEDVLAVLDYLQKEHQTLGINPACFILQGRSAGGQIALATAYGSGRPEIKGCISYYAPTDMVFTYDLAGHDDILRSHSMVLDLMGGTPLQHAERYLDASPLMLVNEQSVPTLLVHGTRDELVFYKQSRRLMAALYEKKRPALLLEMPWATHAFDFHWNGPANQLTIHSVEHFLEYIREKNSCS